MGAGFLSSEVAAKPTIRPLQLQTRREQEVEQEQIFLAKVFLKDKKKQPGRGRACAGEHSRGLI